MTRIKLERTFAILIIFALLAASLALVINGSVRKSLNSIFTSNERHVLASLTTDLALPQKRFKVLKIQHEGSLWIEVYDLNLYEDRIAQFKLQAKFDGQMFVNKKASNLLASDIDGDQILEIIAPSFDSKLQPKIYAFRYNIITNSFSEITNQALIQNLSL